jgi:hypothetical protein
MLTKISPIEHGTITVHAPSRYQDIARAAQFNITVQNHGAQTAGCAKNAQAAPLLAAGGNE